MSLELDIKEWQRWLRQGNYFGAGFPSESSTEHIAVPYKRADSAADQHDDFMASKPAECIPAERIEAWVSALYEPLRAVMQVHYDRMPDEARWHNLTDEEWQERRARHCARLWSERTGIHHTMDVDRYEAALSLAMDLLQDHEKRRAGGV